MDKGVGDVELVRIGKKVLFSSTSMTSVNDNCLILSLLFLPFGRILSK